nr:proteorhodopsin [uncultured bacterium]
MSKNLVQKTASASLAIQFMAGIVTVATFFVPAPPNYEYTDDVRLIVGIEGASQVVEFVYYFVAVAFFKGDITTWTRYIDWFISTPVMLLSTTMFFVHRTQGDILSVLDLRTSPHMFTAFALNALMLSFGLAMELDRIPRVVGVGFGTLAFTASFSFVARYVDDTDEMSFTLFWCIFGVWLMYGAVATFPYIPRNVAYNLLDIVSKNFYGLFLFVYLVTR